MSQSFQQETDLIVAIAILSSPIPKSANDNVKRPRIPNPFPLHNQLLSTRVNDFSTLTRMEVNEVKGLLRELNVDGSHYSHQHKYNPFDRLVCFLLVLTDSMRYRRLQLEYQWAIGSVWLNERFWVDQVISVLNAPNSPDSINWWSVDEMIEFRNAPPTAIVPADRFRFCIGSVDGTYLRIQRPAKGQGESWYYSAYVKSHAILFITVIDRYGRIRYVDGGTPPGNTSERACYFQCANTRQLPPDLKLLGDGAYHDMSTCYCPFSLEEVKASAVGPLREAKKQFNRHLRRYRVLVEWTFGTIKRNWSILGGEWTRDKESLPRMFLCCCLLYNYLRRIRGLFGAFENVNADLLDIDYPPRPDEVILP
jgi:hypothetical protein